MALGHKYAGFKRTNWENKSPKQQATALRKQFDNLGLKIPAYLSGGVTPSNLKRAIDRIDNAYERQITKLEKEKSKQAKTIDGQLKSTVKQYNQTMKNTIKGLKKLGLSNEEITYLSGQELVLKNRNKSYISNQINLREINLDRLRFGSQKAKKDYIKMLKDMRKDLTLGNIKKTIKKSEENSTKFMKEFLNEEYFTLLSDFEINHLLNKFNNLTFAQKSIIIKLELSKLRERYENMTQEELDYGIVQGIYNKIDNAIENIKSFGGRE